VGKFHLNLVIDEELHIALLAFANRAHVNLSQAVRDLLRHALGVVSSPREAGWYEGKNEAAATVLHAVQAAIAKIPAEPPSK
jgi:hypothetical protein